MFYSFSILQKLFKFPCHLHHNPKMNARALTWKMRGVEILFFMECPYLGILSWKVKVKLLSHIQLFATLLTVDYQAPPSMGFSRKESWSGKISRGSSQTRDRTRVSCIADRHFTLWATKEAHIVSCNTKNVPVSRTKSWKMTDFHSNQNFTNVAKGYLGYHQMDLSLNN